MNSHISDSNLKDLRPIPVKIKTDKVRTLVYDMYALSKLEEIYGSQKEAFEAFGAGKIKDMCTFLWAGLIHEESDLTIDQTMKMVGMGKIKDISDLIMLALNLDLPAPNAMTSQN